MTFFGVGKKEAELQISETPLHAADTSDVESEDFDSASDNECWQVSVEAVKVVF